MPDAAPKDFKLNCDDIVLCQCRCVTTADAERGNTNSIYSRSCMLECANSKFQSGVYLSPMPMVADV